MATSNQQVSVALAQAVLPEGNPGDTPTQFDFVVTRSGETGAELSVGWEIQVAGTDPAEVNDLAPGQLTAGTVNFDAGEEQQTVSVFIAGDSAVEADEQFTLTLDANGLPAGTTLGTASAVATISNDDPTTVFISPSLAQAFDEGNPGGNPATFSYTLTREGDLNQELTVNWQVTPQGDFAVDVDDFGGSLPNGSVTFEAGASEANTPITFAASTDSAVEPDEQFQVELSLAASAPAGTLLQLEEVGGRIVNDDVLPPPEVSIADHSQAEGNEGTTDFTFTVSRTGDTTDEVTVDWAISLSGEADSGDFPLSQTANGQVTIPANETSTDLTLQVQGDALVEGNETFTVTLSNPTVGTLGQATATGTIENDDVLPPPEVSIADHSQAEGNEGTTDFTFTVSRTGDTTDEVTVDWAISLSGEANSGDFPLSQTANGQVTIPANETSTDLTLGVLGDALVEGNETFTVTLSNPTLGTLGQATATGTIENDDAAPPQGPVVTIEPVGSVIEGDVATTTPVTITLNRTSDNEDDLAQKTTVILSIEGITGVEDSAEGEDFVIRGGADTLPFQQKVVFQRNETTATETINVVGDRSFEPDERFIVKVLEVSNGTIGEPSEVEGTIVTDEQQVNVALVEPVLPEGDGQPGETPTQFEFVISRTGKTDESLDVKWDLVATEADPAGSQDFVEGQDITGMVSFLAGDTEKTVTVGIHGDTELEKDEFFKLRIKDDEFPDNAFLGQKEAVATIDNDESSVLIDPSLALEVVEGDSPDTAATFSYQLVRTGDTDKALTVSWAVKPREGADNPVDAEDFIDDALPAGAVTFAPGENGQDTPIGFSFQAKTDTVAEFDEDFQVELSLPPEDTGGTTLESPEVLGTNLDDDTGRLTISPPSKSLIEGDSGDQTPYTFTVTRSENFTGTATVKYTLKNTTTDESDFVPGQDFEDTLEFEDGDPAEKSITINVAGDFDFEGNETFEVSLTEPSPNVSIDPAQATAIGEIENDDQQVNVDLEDNIYSWSEGDPDSAESTFFAFNVTRTGKTEESLDVQWELVTTEPNPIDFATDLDPEQVTTGTVSFAPNVLEQTVWVEILGDYVIEEDEKFTLRLKSEGLPPNTSLRMAQVTATVRNDDALPEVYIGERGSPAPLFEGDEGSQAVTFTVSREGDPVRMSQPSSVEWEVDFANSTADENDLTGPLSGTVDFAPGGTQQEITVNVLGDLEIEPSESLWVRVFNPDDNASIGDGSQAYDTDRGELVILDDDITPPVLSFDPDSLNDGFEKIEGDEGLTAYTYPVLRAGNLKVRTTVDWQVTGGKDFMMAKSNDFVDGVFPSGTLTFEPGDERKDITVNVVGDTRAENPGGGTVQRDSVKPDGRDTRPVIRGVWHHL